MYYYIVFMPPSYVMFLNLFGPWPPAEPLTLSCPLSFD